MEKEAILSLLQQMSIKDKVAQMVQLNGHVFGGASSSMQTGPAKDLGFLSDFDPYSIGSLFNINDVEEMRRIQTDYLEKSTHKIPLLFMSDVIYGFRTILPIPLAQAGSFDFELIEKCASMSAKEAYYQGLHVLFSPMLDLVRDPRWGRVMESPGEDPYTISEFAKSVVKGYQGEMVDRKIPKYHVAACIKHFAGYGASIAGKDYTGADVSTVTLRQFYLPGYISAIKANTRLVMTAFNLIEGVPCTGSKWLNQTVLREENKFDGVLLSDFAAIEELIKHGFARDGKDAAKKALEAGVSFDMMTSVYANHIESLIKEKEIEESVLDEAVLRILELKNDLGLFENPFRGMDECRHTQTYLTQEAKELAIELVEKSCVLLKNKGSLPLKQDQKIAFIGPYIHSKFTLGFWASVTGNPLDTVTLKEGIIQNFKEENCLFASGYNLFNDYSQLGMYAKPIEKLQGTIKDEQTLLNEALNVAKQVDVIVLTFGEQFFESGEGASKAHLNIDDQQIRLIKSLKQLGKPIVGILYTGRPLILTEIEPLFDSLLLVWYPGTMGGIGIANLLSGKVSPSGKLAMTFPRSMGQIPIYYNHYQTGRPMKDSPHSQRFVSRYIDEDNEPLFPFGYGLTYGKVQMELTKIPKEYNESIVLKFTNSSDYEIEEVVQVYIHATYCEIVRPVKELKKICRIHLKENQIQTMDIQLTKEDFGYINNKGEQQIDEGEFDIYIGLSSEDIHHHFKINIKGEIYE